jgi:ATP phosphoribosyltransferase regulatory subunit
VVVDFGVMRSFDYYSGLVVEAYAPEVGVPLGGGGRYDGVLGRFGAPAPAAGFAVGLERLMIALVEQGACIDVAPEPRVVGGPVAEAFAEAARLRAEGVRVALAPEEESGS